VTILEFMDKNSSGCFWALVVVCITVIAVVEAWRAHG
jgi:hypothetical protein